MTITYHAGRRIQGLSTDNAITSGLSAWTPVTFNNSTIVNGMSATGNVLSSANVTGSWASYIRSNEYISPSTGGGEFYFTGQSQPPSLAIGFEKSPFNEYPSAVYQNTNFGWHVTHGSAGNDIYEKTSYYNITPVIIDASVSKITMDSAGLVKYYVDDVLVRTSTVTASGNYYINASFSGASADTASVYIKTPISASLTNVQAGSRFEETDTRKIYYSSKVHTFLLADTGTSFTPTGSGNVEYLVIGGGGAGSNANVAGTGGQQTGGGGGGAGGYRTATGFPVTAQAYTITVGAKGIGAGGFVGGTNGGDSIFSTITSTGGGAGNSGSTVGNCGSGGGGAGRIGSAAAATGGISSPVTSPVQGYAGGNGFTTGVKYAAGGGGGSSAVGANGTSADGGNGGAGTANPISGSTSGVLSGGIYYLAGGGGGLGYHTPTSGTGGLGGGGNADGNTASSATGFGSGGGGSTSNGATSISGDGSSGIVIIKYSSGVNATGGTITTVWTEEA